jgi:Na+-driven multidrug efflux pump
MMPSHGFAMATTTMVGQNIGANKMDRAEKSTWISTAIILAVLGAFTLIVAIFPAFIIKIFNNDPEVVEIGVSFLRIVGISFGFLGIRIVIGGSFRGAGNTVAAMILAIIALWVFRIPLANYFANTLNWKVSGVWWGMFFSNVLSALIGVIWFKRGTWKKSRVN